MSTIKIDNITIYDNDRAPRGLDYLQDVSNERLDELLRSARTERDKDTHFTAFVDGKEKEYILIHRGPDEYELSPGSY